MSPRVAQSTDDGAPTRDSQANRDLQNQRGLVHRRELAKQFSWANHDSDDLGDGSSDVATRFYSLPDRMSTEEAETRPPN